MKLSNYMAASLVAALPLAAAPAFADLSTASAQFSTDASALSATVIEGSMAAVGGGSTLVVKGIEIVGESVVYVVENTSTGVTVSIKGSANVTGEISVGVGTSVTVVADASGQTLVASGKVLAYIPNEIGKSLLYSKKSVERETQS